MSDAERGVVHLQPSLRIRVHDAAAVRSAAHAAGLDETDGIAWCSGCLASATGVLDSVPGITLESSSTGAG